MQWHYVIAYEACEQCKQPESAEEICISLPYLLVIGFAGAATAAVASLHGVAGWQLLWCWPIELAALFFSGRILTVVRELIRLTRTRRDRGQAKCRACGGLLTSRGRVLESRSRPSRWDAWLLIVFAAFHVLLLPCSLV
jgi:hypothetical protein